jgi:uncharacterized protein YukE
MGNFVMLKFTQEDTPRVLKDHKVKAVERHTNVFEELIEQTHKLKIEVQQNRIEKGDAAEEVREWSLDIESKVSGFEEVVDEIKETITREHTKVKNEEEEIEKEKRRLHFEEEKSDHGGSDTGGSKVKSGRFFQVNQQQWKPKPYVYCNSDQHKSVVCDKIVDVASRKKELAAKKRCFNCTGLKRRASECRSSAACLK